MLSFCKKLYSFTETREEKGDQKKEKTVYGRKDKGYENGAKKTCLGCTPIYTLKSCELGN